MSKSNSPVVGKLYSVFDFEGVAQKKKSSPFPAIISRRVCIPLLLVPVSTGCKTLCGVRG